MPFFLAGIAVLALLLIASKGITAMDPRRMAAAMRTMTGAALVGLAGFLAVRGLIVLAIPVFVAGAGILGWRTPFGFPFPGGFPGGGFGGFSGPRPAGRSSRVRTGLLAMELDHDTGEMDGEVLHGRFAGSRLSGLPEASILALLGDAYDDDPQSARLLEAYLDRRQPGWRKQRSGDKAKAERGGNGAMSRAEALDVLGVDDAATEDEIRRAHRALMKRMHPDQGGSTYFAARLNEAKDTLLKG